MILLDTSGLLAWLDARQRMHQAVASAMSEIAPPFLLSPFVLAELDYLLATRVSQEAQHALLEEVDRGAFRLVSFSATEVGKALAVLRKFSDLRVGLTDASLVVLAERFGSRGILTLDERHFRNLPGPGGKPFRLLPADSRA